MLHNRSGCDGNGKRQPHQCAERTIGEQAELVLACIILELRTQWHREASILAQTPKLIIRC
jgi:hypothetical protein